MDSTQFAPRVTHGLGPWRRPVFSRLAFGVQSPLHFGAVGKVDEGSVQPHPWGQTPVRSRWRLVEGTDGSRVASGGDTGSQDASRSLRGQARGRQRYPPNSPGHAKPGPPPAGPSLAARGRGGARRLNHLSLCSSQLNGSGQLKMSSHCLSAQMLVPPPPGLPRLALPPATKPTSEGGSTSPTSPCKHSGSGARGRAGVPEGPPPPPSPTAGVRGSGPARGVPVSLVGPRIEAPGAMWSGPLGAKAALGNGRRGPEGRLGSLRARSRPLRPPPCSRQVAVGKELGLVALGAEVAPRCPLLVENENLLLS